MNIQGLKPLDWAMGQIRQLDDPESGSYTHPIVARITALALPFFEALSVAYEFLFVVTSRPIKKAFHFSSDFLCLSFSYILMASRFPPIHGFKAIFLSLIIPINTPLISATAIFLELLILVAIIRLLFIYNANEFLDHLRSLFIKIPLHMINLIVSPLLGLASPTANDAYHRHLGLIEPLPKDLIDLQMLSTKYLESAVCLLVPPQRTLDIFQEICQINKNPYQIIFASPALLYLLHQQNPSTLKNVILKNPLSRTVILKYADMNQFGINLLNETTKLQILKLSSLFSIKDFHSQCYCDSDFLHKHFTDKTRKTKFLKTAVQYHSDLNTKTFSPAEKVELIFSMGGYLGSHFTSYLLKWVKTDPKEMFFELRKLKESLPDLEKEIDELKDTLYRFDATSPENIRFSDVILFTSK